MKLAVSNIGWTADQDSSIAPVLLDAGAEALEVAPGRVFAEVAAATVQDAQAIRAHWAAQGLPIVSMQALLFGQPDLRMFGSPGQVMEFETYLTHVMSLAGALGCGPLVFGSPVNRKRGDLGLGDACDIAEPIFRRIGDIARTTNTCFCIEANATGYGCDFLTRLDEAAEMVRRVDHPNVGLVLDTGNMMMAEEDPAAIQAALPLFRHVHFSAPQLAPITPHEGYIRAILEGLKSAEYKGHVTLEMRAGDTSEPFFDSLKTLRRLVDEVAA